MSFQSAYKSPAATALLTRHLLRKDSTPLKDERYAGFSSRYA